jgi:NagD protein
MDGVVYRGLSIIPGAARWIAELQAAQTPFLFLTNNSQRTRRDVATRLRRMQIMAEESQVFTCAMATARFLARQRPGGTAYVIGEGGLLHALYRNGFSIVDQDPDYVIVGEGRAFNFEMIEAALRMVERGAKLIATNLDPSCPTHNGTRPGCGAIVAMLESATGRRAFSVGKPSPVMFRLACEEIGLAPEDVTMVGDTMETDILGGLQMGCRTILALSGGTREEDLERFAYRPDLIIGEVSELCAPIAERRETARHR